MPIITMMAWAFVGLCVLLLGFAANYEDFMFVMSAMGAGISAVFCFAIGQIIELLIQIRDVLCGEQVVDPQESVVEVIGDNKIPLSPKELEREIARLKSKL